MAGRDVIDVLIEDHREVTALLREWERTPAPDAQRRIVERVVRALMAHSAAEEEYVYPAAAGSGDPELAATADRDRRAHAFVEEVMARLEDTPASDPTYHVLVRRLLNAVRNHVHDEETCLFPRLRERTSVDERADLAAKVEAAKRRAPTRPHPHAPKRPPLDKVADAGAAVLDRVRDLASGRP
jgi:hemerythrin superfamily protein